MKGIAKNIFLNSFALFAASQMFQGLVIRGGFWTYVVGGLLLAIGFKILRPVLNIIALPFNIMTMGLFSILITSFILFLVTLIYNQIEVRSFHFAGIQLWGVEIHPFDVSLFLSYILISVTIYLVTKFLNSLFD